MVRETSESIVGAVTGTPTAPRSPLLGRYDTDGRLQCTGHTTAQTADRTFAGLLAPAGDEPPLARLDVLRLPCWIDVLKRIEQGWIRAG
ncbi:hypothetical protein ACWGDT_27550 [Streptomyces avermitilis]